MSYEFEFGYTDGFPEVGTALEGRLIGLVIGFYAVLLLLIMAFAVLTYVFHSLGIYTIAKRRGIHHSWLAWLPVGNMWILGSISDQYQYVSKGKVTNRRKVLLGIMIAIFALMFTAWTCWLGALLNRVLSDAAVGTSLPGLALGAGALFLACFVVAVVGTVFQYIAYYDLFVSCEPNNAVVYLVLSIFINVTLPFFVFACRKRDLGMPPRKAKVVPEVEGAVAAEPAAAEADTPVEAAAPAEEALPIAEAVAEEEDFAESEETDTE